MEKQDTLEKEKIITVDLLWFSVLAEHRGKRSERITLSGGITAGGLVDRLAAETPIVAKYRPCLRVAVNQTYVDEDTILGDDDEIALITPVSGG